jgi:hypothetical protein
MVNSSALTLERLVSMCLYEDGMVDVSEILRQPSEWVCEGGSSRSFDRT